VTTTTATSTRGRGRPAKPDGERKRDKPRAVLQLTDATKDVFDAAERELRDRLSLPRDAVISPAAVLEAAITELAGGRVKDGRDWQTVRALQLGSLLVKPRDVTRVRKWAEGRSYRYREGDDTTQYSMALSESRLVFRRTRAKESDPWRYEATCFGHQPWISLEPKED
jgi:hypothetical protein